jgi:hypothetical protein
MISDLLDALHHTCEMLPQATREPISRDVDRGRMLLRSGQIDHAAAVACALVQQIEPLTRRGGQAINASKAGGRGKAKATFRADARAEATRIWTGVPLLPISEVARRVRRSWVKSSQDDIPIPAERTIRRWIAGLAPARKTPQ